MLTVMMAAALTSGVAQAQDDDGVDIERFRPHADAYGYMNLDSAATLQNLQLGLGLWANYSNDPVTIERNGNRVAPTSAVDGDSGDGLVDDRLRMDVQVGMGFEAGFAIVLLAIILDRVTRRDSKGDV